MKGTLIQKLPNPFVMENGRTVSVPEDWKIRREEIKKSVLDICYGGMPPEPDSTEGFLLCTGVNGMQTYLITVRAGGNELNFEMKVHLPISRSELKNIGRYPVVLDGDGCWAATPTEKVLENFRSRGIIFASFNRCTLVRDVDDHKEVLGSPLYRLFPGIGSGSIAGWAWGFSRCIDVLERFPFVDSRYIAVTGHSRGGKTALIAGVTDERPIIVNPNGSGAGGCGCYRYRIGSSDPEERNRTENLADSIRLVPSWYSTKMKNYVDREAELPFDQHYLKALIAPRYFLETNAHGDVWANPPGSNGTLMAAREVYRFLGVEDRILINCRYGGHAHSTEDYEILADLMDCVRNGKAPAESLLRDPYPEMREIFDWESPKYK